MKPNVFYREKIRQLSIETDKLRRKIKLFSILRLGAVVMILLNTVYVFIYDDPLLWISVCASLALLFILTKRSDEIKKQWIYKQELLEISENEIEALSQNLHRCNIDKS